MKIIDVWCVVTSTYPAKYFSDEEHAKYFNRSQQSNGCFTTTPPVKFKALQMDDKFYLLREPVDVDQVIEKTRETIKQSAISKLTKEELDVLGIK